MADNNILYTLEIKGTQTELDRLDEIHKSMVSLKGEIKSLAETDSKGAEKKKIQLKSEQENYRNLQKEVRNNTKAANDGIKTIGGMRASLNNMNKELDRTKVGSKRFKELTVESKKLRDQIKGADEATGRFQGNVGDYKNQVIGAFRSMGIDVGKFQQVTEALSPAMKSATVATTGTSKAMKILKIALISTGIGAIVVAIGALAAAFFSTQRGVDALNKVLIPIKVTFQKLWGIIQQLSFVVASFLGGDWDQMAKDVDNLKDSFGGLSNEIKEAVADGKRLAEIIIEIDNAKIKLAENEGKIARSMAEQRLILENLNNSDKVRKAAGDEYLRLNKELLGYTVDIANLEAEQAELKAKQNDTDREAKLDVVQKQQAAIALEAASKLKTIEVQNKINAIDRKNSTDRLKAIEAEKQAKLKAIEAEKQAKQAVLQLEIDAMQLLADAEMEASIKEALDEIAKTEKNQALEVTHQEAIKAIREAYALTKLSLEEKEFDKLKNLYNDDLISFEDYEKRKTEVSAKYDEIEEKAKDNQEKTEIARLGSSLGVLKNILGEKSKAGKAAGIAQATINTWQAVTEILKQESVIPSPFDFIAKALNVGAVIASGLKAVGAIKSTPISKFARGVIGLRGSGTETSDSIDAKLSKGESVLTAKATRIYAPVLADMERSVGNRPNFQIGNKRFATGFLPRTDFVSDSEKLMRDVLQGITEIPVIVSETDITATQGAVRKIKVSGDL